MTEVAGPTYLIRGYQEFDSNPLIAHLRLPPETDSAAFLALGQRPDFNVQDRDLPNSIRRLRIKRLRRFYVPTLEAHRQALIEIATNVLDGYIARNPMTARGQALLHGGAADLEFRPAISLIAGHSGMGKSTLIDRILAYLGEVIAEKPLLGILAGHCHTASSVLFAGTIASTAPAVVFQLAPPFVRRAALTPWASWSLTTSSGRSTSATPPPKQSGTATPPPSMTLPALSRGGSTPPLARHRPNSPASARVA